MLGFKAFDTFTDSDKGKKFEILDPRTQKGTGAFLTVAGPDSTIYKNATEELQRKLTQTTTMREFETERLIRCTLGWESVSENGKDEMKFSEANLREYFKFNSLVLDQFLQLIKERVNFLKS